MMLEWVDTLSQFDPHPIFIAICPPPFREREANPKQSQVELLLPVRGKVGMGVNKTIGYTS